MNNSFTKIKTITSHAGHFRFLAELDGDEHSEILGYVPRQIATPYASGPSHTVYTWHGQPVIIAETRHKYFQVFRVVGPVFDNDLCQGSPIVDAFAD